MKIEKIAIYARRATSLAGKALDAQVEYCKKMAINDMQTDENQIDFYIYKDIGSGNNYDRAGLQQLFKDIQEKDIKRVYVEKLDRLGRNAVETLKLLSKLQNNGVILVAPGDNLNTGSPMGKPFIMVLAMLADLERENMCKEQ